LNLFNDDTETITEVKQKEADVIAKRIKALWEIFR
jgi:hypothetical protein